MRNRRERTRLQAQDHGQKQTMPEALYTMIFMRFSERAQQPGITPSPGPNLAPTRYSDIPPRSLNDIDATLHRCNGQINPEQLATIQLTHPPIKIGPKQRPGQPFQAIK